MQGDRLSGLDASFLHLEEDGSAHMHVASALVFDGEAPQYDDMLAHVERRVHLVPRYRQRLAFVPLGQGRPRWVDDPHLNLRYHLRHTGLPEPGSEEQLRDLAGRVFSQPLDRDKPLWELWLVDGLEGGRFALLSKTHHALVDGIAGVDIVSVLFDTSPDPAAPTDPGSPWLPRPLPTGAQMLGEALVERMTVPAEAARSVRALLRAPRRVARELADTAVGVGALAWTGAHPAPPTPYNRPIGPHRRFTWVKTDLDEIKAIKDELGGTVNDVVLTAVAGALGRHLRRRGVTTEGLELKAMVPVSVRTTDEEHRFGNRVTAMMAPLPVWCRDPISRERIVRESMEHLKHGGQAVGAETLTELTGFAPPTIMGQAARLLSRRQRFFNVVITNVPGPQIPLYLLGRELLDPFPLVPLAKNQGLGIAVLSYNGRMDFGLVGDYDAMHDLEDLAADLRGSLIDLADAAGADWSDRAVTSTPVR